MYRYKAFGLNINSDIELPSLLETDQPTIDIEIIRGEVNKNGLSTPDVIKPFSQLAKNKLWLHIPEIAWFYITDGNRIIVEPESGADMQSVRLFLLGTCMGAVMHQRNRLVIHANAIRFGDGCVIFMGNSGNGKSTLAARFHQLGYEVLTDDLAVIDDDLNVLPGYPQMKLWQDTADKLGIDTNKLKRIRLQIEKYAYPITDSFCKEPLPVKAGYVLRTHNQEEFIFEPLNGVKKFNPLKFNTYRVQHLEGLGLKSTHLKQCAKLADNINLTRITRPIQGFHLDELIEKIEADLKQQDVL